MKPNKEATDEVVGLNASILDQLSVQRLEEKTEMTFGLFQWQPVVPVLEPIVIGPIDILDFEIDPGVVNPWDPFADCVGNCDLCADCDLCGWNSPVPIFDTLSDPFSLIQLP